MSKSESFDQYPPRSLEEAEAALLTVWRSLERHHQDLVLIGGLAVRYLTKKDVPGLPGAVTLDVDLGVALGADSGQYGSISEKLSGLGFVKKGLRFEREERETKLYADLLTEVSGKATGGAMVDDAPASVILGLNRALACHRTMTIEGKDLYGIRHQCKIKVADIGPLLALKLNAFGGPAPRRHPKDAYDILLAVTGFVDGYQAALARFRAEKTAGNTAMAYAMACLEADFQAVGQDGPARAAAFHPGGPEEKERVRQDTGTVGQALFRA